LCCFIHSILNRILSSFAEVIGEGRLKKLDLEQIDIGLLRGIYEKDFKNKKINWEEFESNNHKAFHLKRLERLGLIEFEGTVLQPGGQRDRKYGTAVAMVWPEGIHITDKGIELLKKENETIKDKALKESKRIGSIFYNKLVVGIIALIVTAIIAWVSKVVFLAP
jgi:hypothetical protein